MNKFLAFSIFLSILACNSPAGKDASSTTQPILELKFSPPAASTYAYTITNQSDTHLELEGKEMNNTTRTTINARYAVDKDSSGDYRMRITYDKIKLYTKKDGQESTFDADHSNSTTDPVEKMLGILKTANITATISQQGEMKSVGGYEELTRKVMMAMNASDPHTQAIAKSHWEQLIQEGVMKKSIDQVFGIFPDSAVNIGDRWTITNTQKGEIALKVTTTYTLDKINNGIAYLSSESTLTRDESTSNVMSFPVTGDLDGRQEGEYEVDVKTGMLLNSSIEASIKGKLQVMGREIPIVIRNNVKMNGRKIH